MFTIASENLVITVTLGAAKLVKRDDLIAAEQSMADKGSKEILRAVLSATRNGVLDNTDLLDSGSEPAWLRTLIKPLAETMKSVADPSGATQFFSPDGFQSLISKSLNSHFTECPGGTNPKSGAGIGAERF